MFPSPNKKINQPMNAMQNVNRNFHALNINNAVSVNKFSKHTNRLLFIVHVPYTILDLVWRYSKDQHVTRKEQFTSTSKCAISCFVNIADKCVMWVWCLIPIPLLHSREQNWIVLYCPIWSMQCKIKAYKAQSKKNRMNQFTVNSFPLDCCPIDNQGG